MHDLNPKIWLNLTDMYSKKRMHILKSAIIFFMPNPMDIGTLINTTNEKLWATEDYDIVIRKYND